MSSCHTNTAETNLRSQFIRGIRDADIRQPLLEESKSKIHDVLKTALAMEASKIQCRSMQEVRQININVTNTYNNTSRNKRKTKKHYNSNNSSNDDSNKIITCYRCAIQGHRTNELYCEFCK